MKFHKLLILFIIAHIVPQSIKAQETGWLFLRGTLPSTFLNPSVPLEKRVNISLAGIDAHLSTDGPSIENMTSVNTSGKRFIDISNTKLDLPSKNNISGSLDIHTIDVSVGLGKLHIMAGHAYKSEGQITYPGHLIGLLAKGNAPFIGQTLDIGTAVNYSGYNEVYIGGQYQSGNISIGAKAKLLFGTNNLNAERSYANFTTKSEFYQWELMTDYVVRSSGTLDFQSFDSVTIDLKSASFQNLFSKNMGYGIDLGISWKMSDNLHLMAGISDLGKIKWDVVPKKYTSQGSFIFSGVDVIDLLGGKENISLSDTLKDIIKVKSETASYQTSLNAIYHLGGTFDFNDRLTFNALYIIKERFGNSTHQLALSGLLRISVFHVGLSYTLSKNNYTSFGLYGRLKAGPFSLYLQSENISGLIKPLSSKSAGILFGTTLHL